MHFDDRDAAKQVAGNLTPRGNRRQLPLLPCGHHGRKPLKIRDLSGIENIGIANAYGNRNKNLNAFTLEGIDVRRVISCQ
jgi:hypothetical protein